MRPSTAKRPATPATTTETPDVEGLLARLHELEDQVSSLHEGLVRSHRLATLGTIASVVAHEYNNILTPILSYAQMALAEPGDEKLNRKALEKALAGAERAAKVSSSLLGFARDEQAVDAMTRASLRQVVDESLACLARDPKKDGIDVHLDLPEVDLAIDPTRLQQVMVNLILNAVKAMRRQGGRLMISAQPEADQMRIEVRDTGPGIPEQVQARLFEPFVTQPADPDAPQHSANEKGTGLGLSLCRDLIEQAGGAITARSAPGQGAAFELRLPLAA